jgi:hypothetical protein
MPCRNIPALILLTATVLSVATPAISAEVTADRLINADREPQNWLMNHRTYDAQRYSPLDKISKENVKDLKLAYAVAIGGTAANENLEATPLAETAFSTSSINGACSIRSMGVPERRAGSCGAWTLARRKSRSLTAARRSGEISS